MSNTYLATLINNSRASAALSGDGNKLASSFGAVGPRTLNDLEFLEELEDRMLLAHGGNSFEFLNPSVHFRSRYLNESNVFMIKSCETSVFEAESDT